MRIGAFGLLVALVAALATPSARPSTAGSPACKPDTEASGDVGSFFRLQSCLPQLAGLKPARFRVASAALPPGLSLRQPDASAAQVAGVPKRTGVYRFTIAASDVRGRSASGSYTVTINPRLVVPARLSPQRVTLGTSYSATVTASGGEPPYTYALSFPGLAIDPSTGVISGTPTANGLACGLPVSVTDATGATVHRRFAMAVYDALGRGPLAVRCTYRSGPPSVVLA